MTALLLQTALNSEQRELAQTAMSSGEALLTILNDVLDFSKIEAGKLVLEAKPFDLETVAAEVIDLLSPQATDKDIELALRWAASTPRRYVGRWGTFTPGAARTLAGNAASLSLHGHVLLRMELIRVDWRYGAPAAAHGGYRASASLRRRAISCSRNFRRPTRLPRAASAARDWGSPSARNWWSAWAAKSPSKAYRGKVPRSRARCIFRWWKMRWRATPIRRAGAGAHPDRCTLAAELRDPLEKIAGRRRRANHVVAGAHEALEELESGRTYDSDRRSNWAVGCREDCPSRTL